MGGAFGGVVAILGAAVLAACSNIGGSDGPDVGALRLVNATPVSTTVVIGSQTYLLAPHEVTLPIPLTLDAGEFRATPTGGAPVTVPVPARTQEQVLIAGIRGHPPGSMDAAMSHVLTDNRTFPQISVTVVATTTAATGVNVYAIPPGGSLSMHAPVLTNMASDGTFAIDAGVWEISVLTGATTRYRNPAVVFNTREPAIFYLMPRPDGVLEGVLVSSDRVQTYPDVR